MLVWAGSSDRVLSFVVHNQLLHLDMQYATLKPPQSFTHFLGVIEDSSDFSLHFLVSHRGMKAVSRWLVVRAVVIRFIDKVVSDVGTLGVVIGLSSPVPYSITMVSNSVVTRSEMIAAPRWSTRVVAISSMTVSINRFDTSRHTIILATCYFQPFKYPSRSSKGIGEYLAHTGVGNIALDQKVDGVPT